MAAVSAEDGLGLDPPLELLVQALGGVGGPRRLALARGQAGEGEQPLAGLLEAVGNCPALQPPLAQERLAAGRDLPRRGGVDQSA
jgi:hypothetical protein